jgi:hypothetical protein
MNRSCSWFPRVSSTCCKVRRYPPLPFFAVAVFDVLSTERRGAEQAGERLIAVLPSDSRRELFEDIARQKSTNVHMMDHSMMAELLGQTAFTGVQPGVHQASWHREGGYRSLASQSHSSPLLLSC